MNNDIYNFTCTSHNQSTVHLNNASQNRLIKKMSVFQFISQNSFNILMQMLISDWLSYMYQSLVHNGWRPLTAYSKHCATNVQTNSFGLTN